MAQSEWGQPGPIEVYAESSYDPMQGWEDAIRFRGAYIDLDLLQEQFNLAGWQTKLESTNSQWGILNVKIPNQDLSDYIDRWEFNIGFKQQELFLNIGICLYLNAAGFYPAQIPPLKGTLEDYLEQNAGSDTVVNYYTGAYDASRGNAAGVIYQMMQLGQSVIEISQPTISRKRTYSYNFTGALMSTQVTQNVWSTAALLSAFGVPADVSDQIAANPATEPLENYAYGWKMRKNNLVILPAKNKIEEQLEWEWDLWTKIGYNYIA